MFFLRRLLVQSEWTLFFVLTYLVALFLAWQLLAKVDFLYPLWYDVLGIEQTIARYGPQNRYRDRFETTTKEERVRLFGAIVSAIHRQGRGLETLVYHDAREQAIANLLTPPEIIHLQDVSRLVDKGLKIGWSATLAWPMLLMLLRRQKLSMPPVRTLLSWSLGVAAVATGLILLIGPVKIFYRLHAWIFPPGHSWFFYYQESLMTMLMKAPDLFAYIALSLAVVSLLVLAGMGFLIRLLYQRS
jgi:hypothetical protein